LSFFYVLLYRVLAQAYSHNNGYILNDLVKKAALLTANLGMRLDEDLNDKTWRYAEIAHSYTIRFFNAAIQERSKDGIGKKAAAVFLANVMFKLHVKVSFFFIPLFPRFVNTMVKCLLSNKFAKT